MVFLLRHSGEIIRGRTGPTRERDDPITRKRSLQFRGCERDHRSLRTVATAGLSLPAASPTRQFPFDYPPGKMRFHGQTAPPFSRAGSSASSAAAHFDQRLGRASSATGAGAIQIPWLNADARPACVAKSTFCLIVMCSRRCHKFTTGWCPSRNLSPPNSPDH